MPFVTVLEGKNRGQTFEFGDKAIIGRGKEAGIQLSDAACSRNHARIYRSGQRFFVVDLGSSNGTKVNDQAVSNEGVSPGDTIRVGGTLLRFEGDRAPAARASTPSKPAPARPATVRPRTDGDSATSPSGGTAPSPDTARAATLQADALGSEPRIEVRDQPLQYSPYADRDDVSVLNEDISQRGAFFQAGIVLILGLLAAALGYGAYLLTTGALG